MHPERVEETLGWLSEHDAAFVAVDAPKEVHVPIMPDLDAVTRDDLAYIRMHGRNAEGYMKGKTRRRALRLGVHRRGAARRSLKRVEGMAETAAAIHVAFNNNRGRDAPTSARRFRQLLGQDPGPAAEEGQLRMA